MEDVYPENHHSLANLMTRMAHVKQDLGDFVSAQVFHNKTVKIRETVFGANHKHTHLSRSSMKSFMESSLNVKSTAPKTKFEKLKESKVVKFFMDKFASKK